MKKCVVCGVKDQDYDKTGLETDTGYYCFNCKPKDSKIIDTKNDDKLAFNNSVEKKELKSNAIAILVKLIAFANALLFLMIASNVSEVQDKYVSGGGISFFMIFGMGLIISLFLYAVGEIIQLLSNIDQNTRK